MVTMYFKAIICLSKLVIVYWITGKLIATKVLGEWKEEMRGD